jgi:hypothetical protein
MILQQEYESLARLLADATLQRKKVELLREERTRPLREQLKIEVSTMLDEYKNLCALEQDLRDKTAVILQQAKALREEAYTLALEAQKSGDMEAVKEAMLKADKAAITPAHGVFFRTETGYEIDNFDNIPKEFLKVDWDKVKIAGGAIAGIRIIELPIVIVKEQK